MIMTASRERKTLSLRLAYYISSPILRLRVGDSAISCPQKNHIDRVIYKPGSPSSEEKK